MYIEMSPQSSKKWNYVQNVAASPDEELVDVSDDDDEEDEIFDEMNLRLMALKTLPEMKPDKIEKQGTQQKGKDMCQSLIILILVEIRHFFGTNSKGPWVT